MVRELLLGGLGLGVAGLGGRGQARVDGVRGVAGLQLRAVWPGGRGGRPGPRGVRPGARGVGPGRGQRTRPLRLSHSLQHGNI